MDRRASTHKVTVVAIAALVGGTWACSAESTDSDGAPDRCEEVVGTLAVCYPDLAQEATCTEETIAEFDRLDLADGDCDGVDSLGKADSFNYRGCGTEQHVCGWIFCCNDYKITWSPKEGDWDIVSLVQEFQGQAPADVLVQIDQASRADLEGIVSASYQQKVVEYAGTPAVDMAVELTRGVVNVPYESFIKALPVPDWGIKLDHYLGGEVKVFANDEAGRVTRQLERMVVSPMPCDYESALSNNDMTKVEVIEYESDGATVYWRVMHSDNNSTEADVGSIDFRRYDDNSTQITFHSAHRLNAPGGIHIANGIIEIALRKTFTEFIAHYMDIVRDDGWW